MSTDSVTGAVGDPAAVAAAVARVEIDQLVRTYADAVTREGWAELDDLFVDGATVTVDVRRGEPSTHTGAAELAAFIEAAIARFSFFEVAVLNSLVEHLDGDRAEGRVYTWELRVGAEAGEWSSAYGLYHDRYRRDGGRWRFEQRHYQSLARVEAPPGTSVEIHPLRSPPPAWG